MKIRITQYKIKINTKSQLTSAHNRENQSRKKYYFRNLKRELTMKDCFWNLYMQLGNWNWCPLTLSASWSGHWGGNKWWRQWSDVEPMLMMISLLPLPFSHIFVCISAVNICALVWLLYYSGCCRRHGWDRRFSFSVQMVDICQHVRWIHVHCVQSQELYLCYACNHC